MITEVYTVKNETGIHARPATRLVKVASSFKSDIALVKNEKRVNAKSIIGVLGLAMAQNEQITCIVEGEDEKEAILGIKELFETNFGE